MLKWYSPMEYPFRISGFPWISKDKVYRRLPLHPEYNISESLHSIGTNTSGGQIGFKTNSSKLAIKVELTAIADAYHMTATAQCGFDCYIGEPGKLLYCNTTKFNHLEIMYESPLFDIKEYDMRNIVLNFPLYQGVKEVLIGLESDAVLSAPADYRSNKPVIFYGTSITQGGCASRPGISYTNILSRRLNMECINLGFSGRGKGEPEIAKIICEIANPACIVLDYEANAKTDGILEKTMPDFISILRETHPQVPILVISRIKFARDIYDKDFLNHKLYLNSFQKDIVEGLKGKGDRNIYYFDGSNLLGDDFDECTVDGIHLTDLGFWRIAENLQPVMERLIFS